MSERTVGELGEHGVWQAIAPFMSPADDELMVGTGDDAAVLQPARSNLLHVVTADMLVAGTHFVYNNDTNWHSLGRRCIVANISDLAAMGARPLYVLSCIGLPPDLPVSAIEQVYAGMSEECARWGARLAGGDTTRSAVMTISITAAGTKASTGAACSRTDCEPGQYVYVSGALGGCRAGLELQLAGSNVPDIEHAGLVARQQVPTPRVELGTFLSTLPKVGLIDVSDGIYNELHLLAKASGVGFEIEINRVPIFPGVKEYCEAHGINAAEFAIFSGEEFELLFCCELPEAEMHTRLKAANIQVPVTCIGRVINGHEVRFMRDAQQVHVTDQTFQHFAKAGN